MDQNDDAPGIVFFDVETTVPTRPGQGFALLEFGAILVCPRRLEELDSFSTLVKPSDLSLINSLSVRCNGITRDAVISAPSFSDISDKVYDFLHGRIWAGHNIVKFDCARIREAFAEIGKPMPESKGMIDSLVLLTQKFGRRAGNMKMASLATYFNLGEQTHRSLDDVMMNLEVVKHCATVLFLESSLPNIFTANSWVSPNTTTRSRSNGKLPPNVTSVALNSSSECLNDSISPSGNLTPSESPMIRSLTSSSESLSLEDDTITSPRRRTRGRNIATSSPLISSLEARMPLTTEHNMYLLPDAFEMGALINEVGVESSELDVSMEERQMPQSPELAYPAQGSGNVRDNAVYLDPEEISIPSINASLVPYYRGIQKMKISHKDVELQISCLDMRVRFGVSAKFVDHAGRPRLNFVLYAPSSLCRVLDACDEIAHRLSVDSGSSSDWRPVVIRKGGYFNSSTVRLHIPTTAVGDNAIYDTELYQKETSGALQKLVFSRVDASELDALFVPGTHLDAYFFLDPYDYQQNAGIRLVAKKLIMHSA